MYVQGESTIVKISLVSKNRKKI